MVSQSEDTFQARSNFAPYTDQSFLSVNALVCIIIRDDLKTVG